MTTPFNSGCIDAVAMANIYTKYIMLNPGQPTTRSNIQSGMKAHRFVVPDNLALLKLGVTWHRLTHFQVSSNRFFYKNALIDIKPPELLPTWRNGRQGSAKISKRLDRFLVAESLLLPSYNSRAWVKMPFLSDHTPICLQIGEGRGSKGHPFKFNTLWLKDPTFINLVTSVWTDCTLVIPGDAQGNLFRKLNTLKSLSIHWLKEKKDREQAELNSIEFELEYLLKQQIQLPSSVETANRIRCLEDARNNLLRDEEERWRIKSRMLWLAGGDKNTSYFHRVACSRRAKKQIWEIEDANGTLHHSQAEIKSAAYTHFKTFFKASPAPSLAAQTTTARLFPRMISPEEANLIHSPCSKEELLAVIKSFKREKSPGPDGWSVELFLHFFDLMNQDILDVIEDSRTRGTVSSQLNKTFVVLIPKSNFPRHFNDFRPISLCNLCYKIISKLIAVRIRPFLSRALSEEQLGFLKGRQILDVVGVAQECIHNIKTKKLQAILLKLDLKKAFDCINWNFLHLILIQSGFGTITSNWIMGCISSATLAILINGEATKAFHCERGLRQGCSLSPLLFILILEGLSILLKNKQAEGLLKGVKVAGLTHILHILFADDVLILTTANYAEWSIIHSILSSFCDVSGLEINATKSSFLNSNAQEPLKRDLSALFGIDFLELEEGFTYLGFYLKSSRYTIKDWAWLIDRFEGRILNWKHRFLSLGGRYILIKAVLESLPVYWMALAHIPATVLKSLRQLSFSFLWSGCKKNRCFHLSKWEELSKPKSMGGWGLKNLSLFHKALSTNTFWRLLTIPGLWSTVIKAKYLHHLPVHIWIRYAEVHPSTGSPTWKNFSSTLPIILKWLSWHPGDGHLIEVGNDCILGLGRKAILSSSLRAHLHDKSLHFLHQFHRPTLTGPLGDSWLSGLDLQLDPIYRTEWDEFTHQLKASGVRLHSQADSLIWTGGDRSGLLTAKNVYLALAAHNWKTLIPNWRQRIWRESGPLKHKLFAWLLLENKLLLWDNLQKRGWEGPNRCALCARDMESTLHVFVQCSFTSSLWSYITSALNISTLWSGNNVKACFQNWIQSNSSLALLPLHLCWLIWLSRNAAIFNDKKSSFHFISSLILTEATNHGKTLQSKPPDRRPFHIPFDRAVAWFDGASQQGGALCGAGGKIALNPHTCICWTLNCGQGTNTKAELIGAWTSLVLASRHTDVLLLLGDSKLTIDWLNGLADFRVAALNCWKDRTKDATLLFSKLTFQHIFREENSEADSLSKKALLLPPSQISFSYWEDGNEGPTYKINL
jgi:ribonuclease HI